MYSTNIYCSTIQYSIGIAAGPYSKVQLSMCSATLPFRTTEADHQMSGQTGGHTFSFVYPYLSRPGSNRLHLGTGRSGSFVGSRSSLVQYTNPATIEYTVLVCIEHLPVSGTKL